MVKGIIAGAILGFLDWKLRREWNREQEQMEREITNGTWKGF